MKLLQRFSRFSIGISIQSGDIRLVRLREGRHGRCLLEAARAGSVAPGWKTGGMTTDWAALRLQLAGLVQAEGLTGCTAALCIPAGQVQMSQIGVAENLPAYAVEAAVHRGLHHEAAVDQTYAVDYVRLSGGVYEGASCYAAGISQDVLTHYIDCTAFAGLQLSLVDIDLYALVRAICYGHRISHPPDGITVLLVIQAEKQQWITFDEYIILDHRSSMNESRMLVSSIETYIDAMHESFSERCICRLLVCGRDLDMDNVKAIQTQLPFPVVYSDFYQSIDVSPQAKRSIEKDSISFLPACGVAMRGI